MNPIPAVVLLAFAVGVAYTPWRRAAWTTPGRALLLEAGALIVAVVIAWFTRDLAHPTRAAMIWGRLALFAAGYWYACAGGAVLIRRVLELVHVGEALGKGGITVPAAELARGLVTGVLEGAVTTTSRGTSRRRRSSAPSSGWTVSVARRRCRRGSTRSRRPSR